MKIVTRKKADCYETKCQELPEESLKGSGDTREKSIVNLFLKIMRRQTTTYLPYFQLEWLSGWDIEIVDEQ